MNDLQGPGLHSLHLLSGPWGRGPGTAVDAWSPRGPSPPLACLLGSPSSPGKCAPPALRPSCASVSTRTLSFRCLRFPLSTVPASLMPSSSSAKVHTTRYCAHLCSTLPCREGERTGLAARYSSSLAGVWALRDHFLLVWL